MPLPWSQGSNQGFVKIFELPPRFNGGATRALRLVADSYQGVHVEKLCSSVQSLALKVFAEY